MNLTINEILQVTGGKLIIGDKSQECINFSKDTRIIKLDDTYIGIKGENFNGNELWSEALNKGAKTVIVEGIDFLEEDLQHYKNKNIILVDDTLKALGKIAKYKRNQYKEKIPLVGVTGSVGKTSTKDIIANVIQQKYLTLKNEGNNNNNIGMPLTLLRLSNHEAAVIEMGMNHLGEISELTKISQPTISVITNVGTAHIGNLGSRENILKAKLEILEGMDKKVLVVNNDNDLLHRYVEEGNSNVEIHTYGINNFSEVMAEDVKLEDNGSKFVCNMKRRKVYGKCSSGRNSFCI